MTVAELALVVAGFFIGGFMSVAAFRLAQRLA